MDENREFLKALLAAESPSGYEHNATIVFNKYLAKDCKHEFEDAVGNSCFSVGKQKDPSIKVMLSGHIDEIALQVQYIDDKGFIYFIKDGGIDPKVILGANVQILTANGIINGVIGKKPIHVEYRCGDEKDKVTKITDMKIDCGFESKEEAQSMVSIGDRVIISDIPTDLGKHRFSGRGLDDKVGVYITAEVLKRLARYHTLKNVCVYGVACTQEETSASGAVSAAKMINPNYSIDYDVTFATDDDYVAPKEWGDIQLGKGGAIAHGVDSNPDFVKLIKDVCNANDIAYQEFSVGSGGTDTVHIKQSAFDTKTALISIPNRNMHTQVEVCDYRDLESIVDMTVETILALDNKA